MMRVVLRVWLPVALLFAGVLAIGALAGGVEHLGSLPPVERSWLIGLGGVALLATICLYASLWRCLMQSLDPARPRWRDSAAVFTSSWLGRYVPTSAPYVAGKVVLGGRIGYRHAAVGASIIYENLIVICVAAASASIVLPLTIDDPLLPPYAWLLFGAPAAIVLVLLPSPLVESVLRRVGERTSLPDISRAHLSPAGAGVAVAITGGAAVTNGAAFALMLLAFGRLSAAEFIAAGAAFNLAGAAGVAAVPVPGGIGVREVVLIAILQTFVPLEVAAGAALLARLGAIVTDLALGAAGAAWLTARGALLGTPDVLAQPPQPASIELRETSAPETRAA
jgi:uncharacterized membrane protein YbhN (UPF0104 family)